MVKILKGNVAIIDLGSITKLSSSSDSCISSSSMPSPQQFHDQYIKYRKPVIFKNYLKYATNDDWKKVKEEWQLGICEQLNDQDEICLEMKKREFEMTEYWKQRFGHLDVFISELRENGLSHPPNYEKKMNFANAIDHLRIQEQTKQAVDSKWLYVQQVPTSDLIGITKDFSIPNLFEASPYSILGANTFFLGTTNTRTTLHYDRPLVDNLFLQIYGEKIWKLYEPQQGVNFYPFGFDTKYSHVSQIPEIDKVDTEKFPLFEKAQLLCEFILQPGDLVYLPKGHWHHVQHASMSVSLNFWYY
ncbi:hypothetical protein C9374_007366 [Naegleria lovaniensis]|uniref:JmjC domain-containing protein n=1 Tax=Naegleria lovaniensis TaxID=51637 RepID=A0AA88KGH8_NAELO|nr:uncharacterized protein C9374_007366 [Naegleria lovaniensis]KAG2379227.1 hypothetical protein C9374_007366 [Naegleria lovaniensis]